MRVLAMKRYGFTGMLFIPKVDVMSSGGEIELTFEKDISFDFTGDPSTPRSVIMSVEPYPTTSMISFVRNKYLEEILPFAEWTVTSVEPVIDPFGRVAAYRHQVALRNSPDFGYDVARQ